MKVKQNHIIPSHLCIFFYIKVQTGGYNSDKLIKDNFQQLI